MIQRLFIFCLTVWVSITFAVATEPAGRAEFFEREVRPLLVSKCFACHSGATDEPGGDIRFDSLLAIEDSGAIVAGESDSSLLIEAVSYDNGIEMPPDGPLKPSEIETLRSWIDEGAYWPDDEGLEHGFDLVARAKSHWAWQAVESPAIPSTTKIDPDGAATGPIDAFVLNQLNRVGLQQADEVDRPTILRRIHFATTGLPPTPEDIANFVSDERPDAVRRVIDRLLADPQFGVRWSRHWLDLVRYGETYGHEFDYALPHAWRYRDYVVEAFNDDVPFNQFAMEQLAGDLMSEPRVSSIDQTNQSRIGSGFWWLGEAVHAPVDVKDDQAIRIDNQIDVASKTFLGMTVACARCHDHKFDAISQADYTAMVGLLQSTSRTVGWIDPRHQYQDRIDVRKHAYEQWRSSLTDAGRLDEPELDEVSTSGVADPLSPDMQVVFDLSGGWPDGSTVDGWAFEQDLDREPVAIASASEADDANRELETHPSGWLDSRKYGESAVGVWRSPSFVIEQPNLFFQSAGDGGGRVRVIIDGYFMSDYHQLLFGGTWFKPKSNESDDNGTGVWSWHRLTGDLHHYIGHTAHVEVTDDGDGWVGLARVYQSANKNMPANGIDGVHMTRVKNNAALQHYVSVTAKQNSDASPVPVLQSSPVEPRDVPLAIRGDVHLPGGIVPRGDLTALASMRRDDPPVRDRLALARNWSSTKNPLFARVAVNRWWHHVFGRGIVASTDNFGVLGGRPTHPQLLDHLASEFVAGGFSTKQSIRQMLSSRTFKIDSRMSDEVKAVDPTNDYWGRSAIRRLEGEAIRDSLLAVSGRLDRTIGGQSVPIHLDSFMTGRGRPKQSGPLDGDGRRSVFIEVRRNFPSPFLTAFDTPQPSTTAGKRNQSNVPAQALAMLNDPLVDDLLDRWIDRFSESDSIDKRKAITRMYLSCFGRQPSPNELEMASAFVSDSDDVFAGLRDLVDVLVNTKEFTHVR